MKIEKLSKKNEKLSFILHDAEESFANAVRRMIVEEVPTLAVEDVEIKENSSVLYDEMLALRLGLCPIKTDLKSYGFKKDCKCGGEGCARCELKIVLKGSKKGYVFATEAESMDPKCNFVHKMPVVKLLPKQKIETQMTAILGRGREHAKWSPGWVWYFGIPEFKTTAKSKLEGLKHPALEVGKDVKLKDISKWNGAAEDVLEQAGVEVGYSDKDFVFNMETWGQLTCKEMLEQSADLMVAKIEQFESLL